MPAGGVALVKSAYAFNGSGVTAEVDLGPAPQGSSGSFEPLIFQTALAASALGSWTGLVVLVEDDTLVLYCTHQPVRVLVSGALLTV